LKKTAKTAKTVILISFLISALSCKADAVILDSKLLKETIKKDVETQIKSNMANLKLNGNIKVEVINLPYEKIETHEGKNGKVKVETNINLKFFNPVTMVQVKILVNGEVYKSFTAQAKISLYNKVWVAKDYIKRGELLTNTVFEEKETTYLSGTTALRSFDPGKYLSEKNYNPGDVIDFNFIETVPTIIKDSPVSVIFKTNSVSITIPATALGKGNMGDYIKVRSNDYKKSYTGKIIGENLVEVSI